jgi:hypothetical protein
LRAKPRPCPALLALTPEVLQASAKLVLNAEIFRPLHRGHERRELALLASREVHAPSLDREQLVEQPCDLLLIRRIARQHLGAKRLTSASFLAKQLHPIALESVIDSTELLHLRVIEAEPPLHDLGESLAELALELGPLLRLHARL